jgi:hypothetical protein
VPATSDNLTATEGTVGGSCPHLSASGVNAASEGVPALKAAVATASKVVHKPQKSRVPKTGAVDKARNVAPTQVGAKSCTAALRAYLTAREVQGVQTKPQ